MSKLSRRDFLKLGSLAALSAPAVNVIGKMDGFEIVESKEEFGGFAIKRHSKKDPPYQVDDSIYQRPDMRKALNPLVMAAQGPNSLVKLASKEYTRLECAFESSAWTVAMGLGTGGVKGNIGLYSWSALPGAGEPGGADFTVLPKWNPAEDGISVEKLTQMVKKIGKFYGASLVGIAPVDERWFYEKSIDMDMNEMFAGADEVAAEAGIKVSTATSTGSVRDIVMAAMLKMNKDDMKNLVVKVAGRVDASLLPEGVTPAVMATMPAFLFQKMLPDVITTFQPEFLYEISKEIPPEKFPADFDINTILKEDIEVVNVADMLPAATIRFDDGEDSYYKDGEFIISRKLKYVIVLAYEMDHDGIMVEHGMMSEAAVAMGYSKMAFTASTMAQFIRNLGYDALPMGNDTGVSIPMAIDAGLGELSRAGWLITPKYGPRVRISKVLTDLPLIPDQPITFGVTEFCEICGKCAKNCPSKAISSGERSFETPDSGNPGVFKWAIEGKKCLQYWADSGVGCSKCIQTCPFNKADAWLHDATRVLIGAKSGSIDKILLKLDDASGYGKTMTPDEFWEKDNYIHIKA
jgi:reductive dehalogenase